MPLPDSGRKILAQVYENTHAIPDIGDKVAACMAERFLGVPLGDYGATEAGMVAAGQPVLPTRAKLGANGINVLGRQSQMHPSILIEHGLPTKGTSVASRASRAVLGRRAGRFVGRAVPWVGAALTAADVAAIAKCVASK